jgi:hypothetical protein
MKEILRYTFAAETEPDFVGEIHNSHNRPMDCAADFARLRIPFIAM